MFICPSHFILSIKSHYTVKWKFKLSNKHNLWTSHYPNDRLWWFLARALTYHRFPTLSQKNFSNVNHLDLICFSILFSLSSFNTCAHGSRLENAYVAELLLCDFCRNSNIFLLDCGKSNKSIVSVRCTSIKNFIFFCPPYSRKQISLPTKMAKFSEIKARSYYRDGQNSTRNRNLSGLNIRFLRLIFENDITDAKNYKNGFSVPIFICKSVQ